MSLPIPTTNASGTVLDPKQLQAMDAPLIALTQQCGGDLRRLMFAYFSFLHRRTDFYLVPHPDDETSMGFREGDAEKLLLAAFRQFPLRRIPKGKGGKKNSNATAPTAAGPSKPTSTPAPTKKTVPEKSTPSTTSSAPSDDSTTVAKATAPTTSNDASSISAINEPSNPTKDDAPKVMGENQTSATSTDTTSEEEELRYTEEGLQIPVGNGGSTKRYKWTQTIEECSVLAGIPKALHGKDLVVKITASSLSIKSKKPLEGEDTPRTFLEGTLVEKVRPDESTWSVEGGVVIVTLDKIKQTFWKTVIQGDEEIDTELVDNRRHIGEYDDATQAKIRKIIFDQEQYHKGGPTSDEILGQQSAIPPLPPGVEFIDRKKLDEEEKKQKAAKGK